MEEEMETPILGIYEDNDFGPYYPFRRLFLVKSKDFKKCIGDTEPHWYYSGDLYEMAPFEDKNMPMVPAFKTTIINVPRKSIKLL